MWVEEHETRIVWEGGDVTPQEGEKIKAVGGDDDLTDWTFDKESTIQREGRVSNK